MKVFIVNKIDDHFVITNEDLTVSSPRFQWLKKNCLIFRSQIAADEYVISRIEEKNKNRFEKLAEDYDRIESKEDFEKLLDVKLDESGYERLKGFIDYLKNEKN